MELLQGNTLVVIGLLLDIIGAVLLAFPDIPVAARLFRFGKIRAAKEALRHGKLTSENIGFEEFVSILREARENPELTPNDIDSIEYGPELAPVYDDGDRVDLKVESRLSIDYAEETKFSGVHISNLSSPPKHYYPRILDVIERGERRLRVTGIAFIIFGFTLQLLSLAF